MRNFLGLFLCFFFSSCQELKKSPSKLEFFKVEKESYQKIINSQEIPTGTPDLQTSIVVSNDDYPIELSLYKDGEFYYNLPNLGDGRGTWKYENGLLQLSAKRKLFDMEMSVMAKEASAKNLALKFRDRFGPKILDLAIKNN